MVELGLGELRAAIWGTQAVDVPARRSPDPTQWSRLGWPKAGLEAR